MSIDIYVPIKALFAQPHLKVEPVMVGTIDQVRDALNAHQPDYEEVGYFLTVDLQVTIPGYPFSRTADVVEGNKVHFSAGGGSSFAKFMRHWAAERGVAIEVLG